MTAFEHDPSLARVVELLEEARPQLTFDELDRVDRRLSAAQRPRRARRLGAARRRGYRVTVALCLALGLVFMTAGTGLAISGLASPGTAVQAQYPDRSGGATSPGGGATSPGGGAPAPSTHRPGHPTRPSSLGQIQSKPAAGPTTLNVALTRAQTHGDLPFTGFEAIPVLLVGIGLISVGAVVNWRGRRGSSRG